MSQELADQGDGEIIEAEFSTLSGGALAEITSAEVDVQIRTAKHYPRSIAKFKDDAISLACLTPETALSCWYSLPRGGKEIEGPSIRLAEICASAWGNLRYGSRIIGEDRNFITAQGFAHDLERNQAASFEVKRRITNKSGVRFQPDMIAVTANAACSIALRNAIFRVVPRALVEFVLLKARACAAGEIKSVEVARVAILEYFAKLKVSKDLLLGTLGRASIDDVTQDDIVNLRSVAKHIKDGEMTVEQAFPQQEQLPPAGATKAQETLDKINEKKGKKKAAKDEPAKEPAKDAPKEEASKEQAHKEEPKKEQERGDADDSPGDGKLFGGTGDDPSR